LFTGIVDHCGELISTNVDFSTSIRFWIASHFKDLSLGESIAVDGVCLTVTDLQENKFACELSPETLKVTAAENYTIGQSLNLERAMRLNDRLSGHFVTGHVDQTLMVDNIQTHNAFTEVRFTGVSEQNQAYLPSKGSVAING